MLLTTCYLLLTRYCASKAAVGQLHGCLRWELRGVRGVRCLLVRPYRIP